MMIAAIDARTLIGIALVGALATPAVSESACAWVLWWEETSSSFSYRTADAKLPGSRVDRQESRSWNILSSSTTNAECESQQAGKIQSMLKDWRKERSEAKFGEHTITHEPGTNIISRESRFVGEYTATFWNKIRYLCLPDTIDPREKK